MQTKLPLHDRCVVITHQSRIFKAEASTVCEARVATGSLTCNSQPLDFVIFQGFAARGRWSKDMLTFMCLKLGCLAKTAFRWMLRK